MTDSNHTDAARWLPPVVLASILAYASVRYIVFGPLETSDVLIIANKTTSTVAAILLATAWARGGELARSAGRWALWLAMAHVITSAVVIDPEHTHGFFDEVRLHARGQWSLLFAVGAVLLWRAERIATVAKDRWRSLVLAAVLAHVVFLGAPGWLTPERWHGGLPPLTMLASVALVVGGVLGAIRVGRSAE